MIKSIIWDVDGVILDTEQLHAQIESQTAKTFGIDISPTEVTKLYSGVHIDIEFKDMAKRADIEMPVDKALEIRNQLLDERLKGEILPTPFANEVLNSLKGKYKQAFATSSEQFFVESVLKKVNLFSLFDACVYVRDVKVSKPNPEIFLKAASMLGINPSEIAVVEDSESGFKAAKAAGMILITRKADHNREKDFSLADFVVEDLREIPGIIKNIS